MGLQQIPAVSGGVASKSAKISSGSIGGTYTFNNTFETGQYLVNQTAAASFTLGGTAVSNTTLTPINITSSTSSLAIDVSPIATWNSSTGPTNVGTAEGGLSVANGFLYAMGGNGFARSSDGTTWTTITSEAITGECNTAFYNGVYITGAYKSSYGRIYSSTDGINWTERVSSFGSSAGRPPKAMATAPNATNKYIAGGNSGHFYYSTNGTSWTRGTDFSSGSITGAASDNNTTYVVCGSTYVYSSTNGNTWSTRTAASSPTSWHKVAFGNGIFVLVGDGGHINTSTDGATWTNRTSTSGTTQNIRSVAYNASAEYPWMAGLQNGSAIFSTDGINWISRTTAVGGIAYGINFYNSEYRVINTGTAYRSTSNINGTLSSDYFVNFIGPSTTTTVTS
jgi:hypothetical protein